MTSTQVFSWSILFGGITFFFLGLRGAKGELQVLTGDRLRKTLSVVANNRFKAFGLGAFITFFFQSSGATSVLLISLADTGLINLNQAIAMLLGADLSTTVVVILLSIKKITDMALAIVVFGFFIQVLFKQKKIKSIGSIILNFGFIFYGMFLMVSVAAPLKDSQVAAQVFAYFSNNPFASLVLSTIIAAAVHSAGMIGITIALAFAGTISFEMAVPLVLGANLGTCVTAIMVSFGSATEGRRIAAAHTTAKLFGICLAFPFIGQIVQFVNYVSVYLSKIITTIDANIAGKIVLTHIFFNVALAVVMLPLVGVLSRFVCLLMPEPPSKKEEEFKPLYLDKAALETPAIAFAQARREILRIATIVQKMFDNCLRMFSRGEDTEVAIEDIQSDDDKVDILDKAIRFYLAKLSTEKLSEEQGSSHMKLLSITSDLEEIGDTISRELVMLAKKKIVWKRIFSDSGWKDLREFQRKVGENFNLMVLILTEPSEELSVKVYKHEKHIDEVEQQLRQSHFNRLHEGLKESFDTSSIHLDILGNLRRINSKCSRIVRIAMNNNSHSK
ncbi:MAG: hypothetical protein COS89_08665 [Deltaproteobacteria bacterium CG07_land_8_20_14_0_80_38_7]|nr:MAG: hypothetical protein COS89_08665 [Deltaproteobacteria bacterium CG07_land_8_20_14_0_80_38_7]